MSVSLAVIAKEAVESLMNRVSFRSRISKAPFPESTSGVSSFFEDLSNRVSPGRYRELADRPYFPVSPTWSMPSMKAGHDDAASWSTYG